MQRLSLDVFHIRIVQVVSDKGKAQIFHMDTDLMSAACLQDKGDEAVPVLFFYDPVMGDCPLAVLKVDPTLNERSACPADGSVYRAGRRGDVSADDGKIFPPDLVARGHGG